MCLLKWSVWPKGHGQSWHGESDRPSPYFSDSVHWTNESNANVSIVLQRTVSCWNRDRILVKLSPMSGSVSKDCPCYSWSHPMFTECRVPQPPAKNKMVAGSHWVTPLPIPKCGCRRETLGQTLATQCTRTVNGDGRVSALLALEIKERILSIMGPIQNHEQYFF